MVPARVGAGSPHLALPDVLRLQRARRPPPDGAGDGGRGVEGGDQDGRTDGRNGLGRGRHVCQAAAVEARGQNRSGRRTSMPSLNYYFFSIENFQIIS